VLFAQTATSRFFCNSYKNDTASIRGRLKDGHRSAFANAMADKGHFCEARLALGISRYIAKTTTMVVLQPAHGWRKIVNLSLLKIKKALVSQSLLNYFLI